MDTNSLAHGLYDLLFSLYDSPGDDTLVGPMLEFENVDVIGCVNAFNL